MLRIIRHPAYEPMTIKTSASSTPATDEALLLSDIAGVDILLYEYVLPIP